MPSITASGPAITTASRLRVVAAPAADAPRQLPTTTRWLVAAAAAAAVALSGLTVLLNAVEASEAAEYATVRPVASAPAITSAPQAPR